MVELKDFTTRDLAEELHRRSKVDDDVETIVNDRSSCNWVVCSAGRNEPLIGVGECMAIVVKGLY